MLCLVLLLSVGVVESGKGYEGISEKVTEGILERVTGGMSILILTVKKSRSKAKTVSLLLALQ